MDRKSGLEPARQKNEIHKKSMPNAPLRKGIRTYTLSELRAQEFPETCWVVEGLIPEGITIMSAKPASYKTWLLLEIAKKVANGDPLFGRFTTEQAGVLMIDEENSARLLQQRVNLLTVESHDADLPVHIMIEQEFNLSDMSIERVINYCIEYDIRLITIDSLIRIYEGDENSSVSTAEVFKKLRRFSKAGISILVTHHHRKSANTEDASQEMRGSSDILAAVDCHIALKRDGHRIVLTQTKLRYADEHEPVELEINSENNSFSFQYLGTLEPIESKRDRTIRIVKEMLGTVSDINQKKLHAQLIESGNPINIKTLRTVLNWMLGERLIIASTGSGNELLYSLNTSEKT